MSKTVHLFLSTLLALTFGCSKPKPLAVVSISERHGLDRELEYVRVKITLENDLKPSEMLVATHMETGSSIPVQVLDTIGDPDPSSLVLLFPIKLPANGSGEYHIVATEKMRDAMPSHLRLSEKGDTVENSIYKANFSTENDSRGGQINGIHLKEFNGQLLKRGHIAMHWAPNFSKSASDAYFNMESFTQDSENQLERGIYQISKTRSGVTDSVPEIDVEGTYTFYEGLPYFEFASTMSVNRDVELDLLRNDEMTMDSLFTHVMYRKNSGSISHLELYGEELDVLDNAPIPDDAHWVAFYHAARGYGYGSIRLEYDNTNEAGKPSATYRPYTKISRASNAGRYWNRVLIGDTAIVANKGDRYRERNAYLIFRVGTKNPEREMMFYQQRLTQPLAVRLIY